MQYGIDGADPPQIDVQPVALAILILSPNNCVTSFTYGVSPQPAHAPENSRYGVWNWVFLKLLGSIFSSLDLMCWDAYSQLAAWTSISFSNGDITRAFSLAGQTWAQFPHPVQSRGEICILYS